MKGPAIEDYGVPGAAKNTGVVAWLFENRIIKTVVRAKAGTHTASSIERGGGMGPRLRGGDN